MSIKFLIILLVVGLSTSAIVKNKSPYLFGKKGLESMNGLFAINGNDSHWRATFNYGVFTPSDSCSDSLGSSVETVSNNTIYIQNWCGHGSIFNWNTNTQCWDEFDTSVNSVTQHWCRVEDKQTKPNPKSTISEDQAFQMKGEFSINGNDDYWIASFEIGKFQPNTVCAGNLHSTPQMLNETSILVENWCGHQSIFNWNQSSLCWDEFDSSAQRVTSYWCRNNQTRRYQPEQEPQLTEQQLKDMSGLFAIDGNHNYWRATFENGTFIPAEECAGNLQSTPNSLNQTSINVPSWCGHGSIFNWNDISKCWDEFDTSVQRVTCQWCKVQKLAAQDSDGNFIYAINGNPKDELKAIFPGGKFTPLGNGINQLGSEIVAPASTYSYTSSWFGHPSVWIFNPEKNCYDEYDGSAKTVTCTWCQLHE